MIQERRLGEADFRGPAACGLHDHRGDLKGNNDLLVLTRPDVVRDIHDAYFAAGADITETNTFSATRIAQADYGLSDRAREINCAAAAIARESADRWTARTPDKPRFVAGSLGPTNRTASISPDVNDPGARNVTFDELAGAYGEAIDGLLDGGADLLLVETVFDTLNAKAALYAHRRALRARGPALAGHRVGDDHRRVGPHAVGTDAGGVLERDPPHPSARRRPQLRARRRADAAVHRGDRQSRRHVRVVLSERGPAQSHVRYGLRRDAGGNVADARASSRGAASSTSSAAAAARPRRTSARSPTPSRRCRRASFRARRRPRLCRSRPQPRRGVAAGEPAPQAKVSGV